MNEFAFVDVVINGRLTRIPPLNLFGTRPEGPEIYRHGTEVWIVVGNIEREMDERLGLFVDGLELYLKGSNTPLHSRDTVVGGNYYEARNISYFNPAENLFQWNSRFRPGTESGVSGLNPLPADLKKYMTTFQRKRSRKRRSRKRISLRSRSRRSGKSRRTRRTRKNTKKK